MSESEKNCRLYNDVLQGTGFEEQRAALQNPAQKKDSEQGWPVVRLSCPDKTERQVPPYSL